jgi:hypothetical protein
MLASRYGTENRNMKRRLRVTIGSANCVLKLGRRSMRIGAKLLKLPGLCIAVAIGLLSPCAVSAAEITVINVPGGKVSTVFIKGEFQKGDGSEFLEKAGKLSRALVVLSSPGGSVTEALQIGAIIRIQGLATAVGDECDSACALVWLSGARRYYNPGVHIGFHAAYVQRNGELVETGMGNAEIGSFLTQLGLSLDAIRFVTAAPPNGVRWLSLDDAKRLGIAVIEGPSIMQPGDTPVPPIFETRPAPNNPNREEMYAIASAASALVTTLDCSKQFHIDEVKIRAIYKQFMDEGTKLGDGFASALSNELTNRATELRRDGLQRYCETQRQMFEDAGISGIFLD